MVFARGWGTLVKGEPSELGDRGVCITGRSFCLVMYIILNVTKASVIRIGGKWVMGRPSGLEKRYLGIWISEEHPGYR